MQISYIFNRRLTGLLEFGAIYTLLVKIQELQVYQEPIIITMVCFEWQINTLSEIICKRYITIETVG